ncbi:M23 family metallopeptidase [Halobacillus salinus]|uniref:M23 family metallopeptidase n=1 Tax=Halobacillus salinus TaxID=192814 RepID=A0A4Z0H303_9BACI|nr:M23 family metallopeptidase [Halobacillus salinus]TGB03791.1 M23 family metallopeptidase [Halobacillus salinus]
MSKENVPFERDQLGNHLVNGDYTSVYNNTSEAFQDQVSFDQFKKLGEGFIPGDANLTLQTSFSLNGQDRDTWVDDSGELGALAAYDKTETIIGLQLLPLESYPETDQTFTKTSFELPFQDEWLVFWGGTNELANYHYAHDNQRYAYDFVVSEDGQSFVGDGSRNENYHTFGKKVVAPADGEVVRVVDGIKDNEPVGTMNADSPAGNYVVIDHGNEEYSFLAHFQKGSIQVEEGDQIRQGDVLGAAGNSGNSSEPHIHFHVSDSPDLDKGSSIRIQWESGKEYLQGQIISND